MPTPKEWGPHLWYGMHAIAGAYPDQPTERERRVAVSLLESLSERLPCSTCSANNVADIRSHPIWPHTVNRDALEQYVYDLHNRVNVRTGKPINLSLERVRKAYREGGHGSADLEASAARAAATAVANETTKTTAPVILWWLLVALGLLAVLALAYYVARRSQPSAVAAQTMATPRSSRFVPTSTVFA